ncbi:MAG: Fic family protein [Balneolales bacterium]
MEKYNWQQKDWPNFRYSLKGLEDILFSFAEKAGRISGLLQGLPEDTQQEAVINMMVAEAIKTSEIEGEYLSRKDVLSSIRKNLGLHGQEQISDMRAAGLGELMLDVRNTWREPLTRKKLFDWHKMLLSGNERIQLGAWRSHSEPMQVVSGAMGKEKVHYEAPPSECVAEEMNRFIEWFNETAPVNKPEIQHAPVRSAVAHLYFETIHPFEDGNGRIGRAIAEKALSQGLGRPVLLSMSETIESNKKAYYSALQKGQRSNEITDWIHYFVDLVHKAQLRAEELIEFTLRKVKYFDRFDDLLNVRQKKVIRRMMDEGPEGFEGGMNARKYRGIAKVSKATATRDLQELVELGAIERIGKSGGRSTSYRVKI